MPAVGRSGLEEVGREAFRRIIEFLSRRWLTSPARASPLSGEKARVIDLRYGPVDESLHEAEEQVCVGEVCSHSKRYPDGRREPPLLEMDLITKLLIGHGRVVAEPLP